MAVGSGWDCAARATPPWSSRSRSAPTLAHVMRHRDRHQFRRGAARPAGRTASPASLTKIDLYLLFEQIEAGKLKLDTPLNVSAHASGQLLIKLGPSPVRRSKSREAIKALVTGRRTTRGGRGSDRRHRDGFARLATSAERWAWSIPFTSTPRGCRRQADHDGARRALLGRAIQDRFPTTTAISRPRAFSFAART